ncbi:hypothetical protein RJ639_024393 [Escallonia herrerae]|uniref:Protein POLYCHOME-like n=1 Tax=Escallonia herrerae TaxID=1293975 RepID=A0AA88UZD7_9ASTE|nr:hypothetical protein RJ639_024393 [Escallonia herrerae]
MPESRDRLLRQNDIAETYIRRLRSTVRTGILADEPEMGAGTGFRWGAAALTGTRGPMGVAAQQGAPRIGNGVRRSLNGTPPSVVRRSTPARASQRGRGAGSNILPSWYPRRPLGDVTAVVRGIERRRARLRESEDQQIENPLPQGQNAQDSFLSTSGARLKQNLSLLTPNPTLAIRPCPTSVGKVTKILLDITNQNAGEPDSLTPQKRLLNSIDAVEKVVMEEMRQLEKTPAAKKAEREKRVRTLMSMR